VLPEVDPELDPEVDADVEPVEEFEPVEPVEPVEPLVVPVEPVLPDELTLLDGGPRRVEVGLPPLSTSQPAANQPTANTIASERILIPRPPSGDAPTRKYGK
jgi:hypothetical protein